MNRNWAGIRYSTSMSFSDRDGWTALDLAADAAPAARVIFWDAAGQFYLEVSAKELPLGIVEELIREAKDKIRMR